MNTFLGNQHVYHKHVLIISSVLIKIISSRLGRTKCKNKATFQRLDQQEHLKYECPCVQYKMIGSEVEILHNKSFIRFYVQSSTLDQTNFTLLLFQPIKRGVLGFSVLQFWLFSRSIFSIFCAKKLRFFGFGVHMRISVFQHFVFFVKNHQ